MDISNKVDLNQTLTGKINKTHTIIHSILRNDPKKLQRLLKKDDINGIYPCKELKDEVTPLMAAVAFQKDDIFKSLLQKKANPNRLSLINRTALHYASNKGIPLSFTQVLLAENADPNLNLNNCTPLNSAVINDREDLAKALISAGAIVTLFFSKDSIVRNQIKLSEMLQRLASNGLPICSEIKHFVDLGIALRKKSPEEVFKLFDHVMLLRNPQTHLSIIDAMLLVNEDVRPKYRSKSIQWLKDNHKIDLYIEGAVNNFPNLLKIHQPIAVHNLSCLFLTLTEIPNNVSLALIPKIIELLSTEKEAYEQGIFVFGLYVIALKTKVKDDWNWEFIEKLGLGISSYLKDIYSDTTMAAYGIFANLVSSKHANGIFKLIGLYSLPGEVITAAEMRMDVNLKESLMHLQKCLIHPNLASQDSISAERHNASSDLSTASVQESVANERQPGNTTFRKELMWLKNSKRWREDLEKLSKSEDIIQVGSILFVNDKECRIATGSDGTEVFLGLREDGTEVAVKRMSKTNDSVLKNEESYLRLPELEHENIVRYMDYAKDNNFGYLALQLCECTLEEFLKHDLTEEGKRKLIKEVLISLNVLHGQTPPIIHRDIKPQNVLLDVLGKARLADFGISRTLPKGQTSRQTKRAGTKCWMATENIAKDDNVACKMSADIQVAGMLAYYILSGGHHPFGEDYECEYHIHRGQYNLEHVQDMIAKNLIEWMINKTPEERPTVKECLAHAFLWDDPSDKIDYLEEIGNLKEVKNYGTTEESLLVLLGELDRDVGEASWKDWKKKFSPVLVQTMDSKGKYSENTAGLLRFIRNFLVHHPEDAEPIDLMATFPVLFGGVYVFAKNKGWNDRPSMRKVSKQVLKDVTSGGAMNTLSLEDRAPGFSVPVQESGGPPHSVTVIP